LDIIKGRVASCSIKGDFLGTHPIEELEMLLEDKIFAYQEFEEAIDEAIIGSYLGNITKEEFLSLIFSINQKE
jgi:lipoate-protein ligase A